MKSATTLFALLLTATSLTSKCTGAALLRPKRQAVESNQQQTQPKPDPKSTAPDSAAKPKRKTLDADLSGFDISDAKSDKKVTTMLGGSRSTAIPSAILLAPRRAKFYGANATFEWSFAGHSEGYVIIITDDDETQIIKQAVKEPHYRLNPATAMFEPGQTYYWRVQVLPNPLASEPSEFIPVTAEERQAIDQAIVAIPTTDPYQSALARAKVFTDHRLWFDAVGAYDDLIAKYPDRSELYGQRGAIYAQVPAAKLLSEDDFTRANKSPK